MLDSASIKKALFEYGVDLAGIGNIHHWTGIPKQEHPSEIMPRAKSVICFGFQIHRGTLRGAECNYHSAYTLSGFDDINRVIAPMVQRRILSFIESHGYEAAPIMYYGKNLSPQETFFNFRTGAMLCGVGEIGHSRVLLTPQFGPAQRLYFVITEAELEADPIITGICNKCMKCVKECPAKALEYETLDNIDIPAIGTIKRSRLDEVKCRIAHIAGGLSVYAPDDVKQYCEDVINDKITKPALEDIDQLVTQKVPYAANAQKIFGSPSGLCGDSCIRACLTHLDKQGKLTAKFRHPFGAGGS